MNPRQKAKDLIELAAHSDTPEKERLSAAVKAVALIRKYDLISDTNEETTDTAKTIFSELLSRVDSETLRAAKSIFDVFTDPEFQGNVKKVAGARRRRRR